ncbi:MAG: alpha-L-fucosidase [Fusicatenibacter sp.]|nr:alpha-L-fucosidase [Fusicatenibacter sp.]
MIYNGLEEDRRLIQTVPTMRQLAYENLEFLGYIHLPFGTGGGKEGGKDTGMAPDFLSGEPDVEQWARTAAAAGMRALVLSCKHHDGFCLWPSQYTEYSIKNTSYKNGKGDLVKETAEACGKYGLQFGIYLSPLDQNSCIYGMGKDDDDYYVNQLRELLTNYGDIFAVYMDDVSENGANGRRQKYDWERYYQIVRELQPNAVIAISGPDVRLRGISEGEIQKSEWSVVPAKLKHPGYLRKLSQKRTKTGTARQEEGLAPQSRRKDLGSRKSLAREENLIWYPLTIGVSIYPGPFYQKERNGEIRSLQELQELYLNSVGRNAAMLLDISPLRNGRIALEGEKRLEELGFFIRNSFADNLLNEAQIETIPPLDVRGTSPEVLRTDDYQSYFQNEDGIYMLVIKIFWPETKKLNYLVIKEEIPLSQRVESFRICYEKKNRIREWCKGTTIGYKRIVKLQGMETECLIIAIEDSRVAPAISYVAVY